MTRLEQLVAGSPVEWRTLGEVADVTKLAGPEFTQHMQYSDSGSLIAIRALNVQGRLDLSEVKYIDGSSLGKLSRSKLRLNDLLLTYVGSSTGNVALVDADDRYYLGPNVCRIRFTGPVYPRYALHYFQSTLFRSVELGRSLRRSTMKSLSVGGIRGLRIPIPSLAVQREVAHVLDAFTASEAELEGALARELSARRKQYAYYRDRLLTFGEDEVEWRAMGEVATLRRGESITRKESNRGEYPVISGGLKPAYHIDRFNRSGVTITVAGSGANAGHVMYWETPIFVNDAFSIEVHGDAAQPRYVYHFLLSIQKRLYGLKVGVGVPHVYAKDVAQIQIPIPSLARQAEIVRVLDRLHALSHSLMDGLPAELRARRKQYEHYRERLLTFPGAPDSKIPCAHFAKK